MNSIQTYPFPLILVVRKVVSVPTKCIASSPNQDQNMNKNTKGGCNASLNSHDSLQIINERFRTNYNRKGVLLLLFGQNTEHFFVKLKCVK